MTLRLRVSNEDTGIVIADTFAKSASVSFGLNKSVSWTAEFPVVTKAVQLIDTGLRVDIYYRGILINSGVIQDYQQEYVGVDSYLKLKGRSDLDILFDDVADGLTYYENEYLMDALYRILSQRGWRLGDISTWDDPYKVISNDLSQSKTIIEQINKLLKDADTNLFYRNGEPIFGDNTLDVGLFNQPSGVRFITPPAGEDRLDKVLPDVNRISKLSVTTKSTDIIGAIVATGGNYTVGGVETRLSLREYIEQDPTRLSETEFPVVETVPFTEYKMFNAVLDPYPGGVIKPSLPLGTPILSHNLIGDFATGSTSTCMGVSFMGIGGRLRHFKLGLGNLGTSMTPAYQNSVIDVEVAEVLTDPYNYTPANTTLLFSMKVPIDNPMIANAVWDLVFPDDDGLILEFGKRYCIRIGAGYTNVSDAQYFAQVRGVADAYGISDYGIRTDWNNNQFSSLSVSRRYTTLSQIEIEGINSPRYAQIKQSFDQYTPETDGGNNTADEIDAAVVALNQRARAVLRDRSSIREDWSMEAVGNNLIVNPGDTVFVQGTAEKVVENPASQNPSISRLQIAKNLRVDQVDLKFDKDSFTAKYKLLEGDGLTEEESFISIYDETKFEPKEKGIYYTDVFLLNEQQSSLAIAYMGGGNAPDAVMSDGRAAKLVTLNWEKPLGTTYIQYAELIAKPFQLGPGVAIDDPTLPYEIFNTTLSLDPRAATLTWDALADPRDSSASVFATLTDGGYNTGFIYALAPIPYTHKFTMQDDLYDWVITRIRQVSDASTTARRQGFPGSFTFEASSVDVFDGEQTEFLAVENTALAGSNEIREYVPDVWDPSWRYIRQLITFTYGGTWVAYGEAMIDGYRVTKRSYIDNYDIELVTDIDNENGVGVIIKVAPKKRDWSVLDYGSFGAYYYWR